MRHLLKILAFVMLSGCYDHPESLPVTLYRETVEPGNAVVHFVSWADPNGIYSMNHCEALKNFYEHSEDYSYVCSLVVFEDYFPRAEWNLAK